MCQSTLIASSTTSASRRPPSGVKWMPSVWRIRTSRPVSPGDIVATIYHLLGIDPHLMVPDRSNRPMPIAHGGEAIMDIVA